MKRYISILLMITLMVLPSCSSENQSEKVADGKPIIENYMPVVGEDDPVYLHYQRDIVDAEDGYYFTNVKFNLYYFDKATKQTIPVCNKPNCKHNDENCNAYIGTANQYGNMWYYDGSVYIISYKDNNMSTNTLGLCEISKDGATHKYICDLAELGPNTSIVATIHRGYVYYSVQDENSTDKIFMRKLQDNSKPEIIYELKDTDPAIAEIRGYGNGLIITTTNTHVESDTHLYYYNFSDNSTVEITPEGFYGIGIIAENYIIYNTKDNVLKCDMETGEISPFYNKSRCYMSYDGKYVYLDNHIRLNNLVDEDNSSGYKRTATVMDLSGNIIDEIPLKSDGNCYFGDEDYILFDMKENYGEYEQFSFNENLDDGGKTVQVLVRDALTTLCAYDKSQIGSDKEGKWITLKEWDYNELK